MKKYVVGGYIRDMLMFRKPSDKDFVVVGATPNDMIKEGFKQVGKEFPVFLDKYGNEYALARTERKTGNKHTDFEFVFTPDTTLEEDIFRRDITINGLAIEADKLEEIESGVNLNHDIIDYVGGLEDLYNHIIRAIRPETFVEDNLRVLRVGRFIAQLSTKDCEFTVDKATEDLCSQMVKDGMLEYLTPERIWKETQKALYEDYHSELYFKWLHKIGALKVILPEIDRLFYTPEKPEYHPSGNTGEHTMICLRKSKWLSSKCKFAVLFHDVAKGTTPPEILPAHHDHDIRGLPLIDEVCDRLRIPNDYRNFAKLFCKTHMRIAKLPNMSLKKQYDAVEEISNGFKDKKQMEDILSCFYCDFFGEDERVMTKEEESIYDKTVILCQQIYSIMEGIGVKDLPIEYQESLTKFKGEKFGQILREYKIRYLRSKLNEEIEDW